MKRKTPFWIGIAILTSLTVSYLVKIPVDSGSNYQTFDSLLGIIIFHSPLVLIIYLIIATFLIVNGKS